MRPDLSQLQIIQTEYKSILIYSGYCKLNTVGGDSSTVGVRFLTAETRSYTANALKHITETWWKLSRLLKTRGSGDYVSEINESNIQSQFC